MQLLLRIRYLTGQVPEATTCSDTIFVPAIVEREDETLQPKGKGISVDLGSKKTHVPEVVRESLSWIKEYLRFKEHCRLSSVRTLTTLSPDPRARQLLLELPPATSQDHQTS